MRNSCTGYRCPGSNALRLVLCLMAFLIGTGCDSSGDPRPEGTLDDLLELRDRDDLNVLFVLVDTLRADRLHSWGYERETSPNLDRLASSGIQFTNHIAQSSWTKCSMASLWTGLHPSRTGVVRAEHALPDNATLPAEIFLQAGYRTAAIYRNAWLDAKAGFSQGFEVYQVPQPPRHTQAHAKSDVNRIPVSDGDVIRSAAEFIRVHAAERWFLYLHLIDVHQYVSDDASATFGFAYDDFYDNAILWTDQLMGHLLDELDRRGLRDRTLIIFASDHGEAFGEHGREGHARDVHGEVIETPLILSLPFRLDPGIVVDLPSQNIDIWPTILELVGLPALEEPDGRSLLPQVRAATGQNSQSEGETGFAQIDQTWGWVGRESSQVVSVTDGPWRLIYYESEPEALELYNTSTDPLEKQNLALEEPDITQQLAREAKGLLSRQSAPWGETPSMEIDEMDLDLLRALGYGVQQ